MRRTTICCAAAVALIAGCAGSGATGGTGNPAVAFTDVSVIDVESGEVTAGRTVLVRGNRIAEIGPRNAANGWKGEEPAHLAAISLAEGASA